MPSPDQLAIASLSATEGRIYLPSLHQIQIFKSNALLKRKKKKKEHRVILLVLMFKPLLPSCTDASSPRHSLSAGLNTTVSDNPVTLPADACCSRLVSIPSSTGGVMHTHIWWTPDSGELAVTRRNAVSCPSIYQHAHLP